MKRIFALGAAVLVAVGLYATASAVASAAPSAQSEASVCPDEGKVELPQDSTETSITVTAPPGMVITGYCVKAGSEKQGEGAFFVVLDPPLTEVTIEHPSGKEISHYTVFYGPAPSPSPSTTPES